jgi:methyltransferase-like protein
MGPVRRKRGIAHRQVEGQTVIVLAQAHEAMVLNTAGSHIWELSDGQRDVREIATAVAERFDVTLDQAVEDVTRFYAEMIGAGTMEAAS